VSPLLPLLAEEVYRGLTREESVHLCDWPDSAALPAEPELVRAMDRAREVCTAALALRRAHDVRVRQPLRELIVAGADVDDLRPFSALIADEVNVKSVALSAEIERYASFKLAVNARQRRQAPGQEDAGSDRGRQGRALEAGRSGHGGGRGRVTFGPGLLAPARAAAGGRVSGARLERRDRDPGRRDRREPRERGASRAIWCARLQQARRQAGLHVSDRIHVALELPGDWRAAAERFRAYIAEQTLATELGFEAAAAERRLLDPRRRGDW